MGANGVVSETHNQEQNGQDDETHELDGLSANPVDKSYSDPVTWNSTGANNDHVSNSSTVEDLVDVSTTRVANCGKDNGVVERDTIVSDIKEEPRTSSSEKDLSVLPLTVVSPEVGPRCFRDCELVGGVANGSGVSDLVWVSTWLVGHVGLDVRAGLDDIAGDIEGVTRSLGNGQTVVEGNAAWDSTETDDDTPHLVNGKTANT